MTKSDDSLVNSTLTNNIQLHSSKWHHTY